VAEGLTDGELTVLGLLAEQPRHGYDLDRVIEQRGIREWTSLGFSSIYYLLDRLAKRGLTEAIGEGRRAVHRPTAAGYALLADESLAALAVLTPVRARALIGLANSPGLDPASVAERLARRAELLSAEFARVRAIRAAQEPLPEFVRALFAYGEAMIVADLQWTEQLLRKGTEMEKYDLKAARKDLYAPSAKDFSIVDVPDMTYLAIDGSGGPDLSGEFGTAFEALYPLAYAVKFGSRATHGRDFVIPPLQGLWWADDMTAFVRGDKASWRWTLLIALPDWITADDVESARAIARKKKDLPALDAISLRTLREGRCVQILHVGSFEDEGPVLARLHQTYLPEHGLVPNGEHHEIYLSDARRTEPAKLKTILRQPVRDA
jgi:DNA-binding PadR family transcriptional regulator